MRRCIVAASLPRRLANRPWHRKDSTQPSFSMHRTTLEKQARNERHCLGALHVGHPILRHQPSVAMATWTVVTAAADMVRCCIFHVQTKRRDERAFASRKPPRTSSTKEWRRAQAQAAEPPRFATAEKQTRVLLVRSTSRSVASQFAVLGFGFRGRRATHRAAREHEELRTWDPEPSEDEVRARARCKDVVECWRGQRRRPSSQLATAQRAVCSTRDEERAGGTCKDVCGAQLGLSHAHTLGIAPETGLEGVRRRSRGSGHGTRD